MPDAEKLITCKHGQCHDPRPGCCLPPTLLAASSSPCLSLDYACSHWDSKLPRQGWMYLSSNHLCFYSLMGKRLIVTLPWTDVSVMTSPWASLTSFMFPVLALTRSSLADPWIRQVVSVTESTKMFLADGIVIRTRKETYQFYLLAHRAETKRLIQQVVLLLLDHHVVCGGP